MFCLLLRVPYKLILFRVADIALHYLGGHNVDAQLLAAAVVHLLVAALLGVEVILPGLARDQLPPAGNFYAL